MVQGEVEGIVGRRGRGTEVAAGKEHRSFCVRSSCVEGDKADRW
jgi:hypothetical protein